MLPVLNPIYGEAVFLGQALVVMSNEEEDTMKQMLARREDGSAATVASVSVIKAGVEDVDARPDTGHAHSDLV